MSHHIPVRTGRIAAVLATLAAVSGCVLAPRAARDERTAVESAGTSYREPFADRVLPDVSARPSWREVVTRTLAANGDLEAAYFAWAAAVHRIDRAGAWPNTPFSLDVSRSFGAGSNRTSATVGFDPMENLAFPGKTYAAARVATDDAQAAGRRFVASRFDLRRRTLTAWADYGLLAERRRIAVERAGLARIQADAMRARVAGGGEQALLVRAEYGRTVAVDETAQLDAELVRARAALNAMMARSPDAPLAAPAADDPPRPLALDDADVLALAGTSDPELAVAAREVASRRDAVTAARLQYVPDVNPFVGIEGAASQMAGMAISIPTVLREVGAMVRESRAELGAAVARQRQMESDRTAALIAALRTLREGERRTALAREALHATATAAVAATERAYAADTATFEDVVAARTTLLDVALVGAEARAARERALADVEALLGADAETLIPATTVAAEVRR